MSENIYDILAKLPKDTPTSFKEVETVYESVDPHDFILDEACKLEEKFYKYKSDSKQENDPSKFKIAKAKREMQLAMAEYPEASSPEEAIVARMGDQAEETKKVIDNAKATIAKQQQEIDKTAQAVTDANARYNAQEKRFQDFNQQVASAKLDVQQQAQAALDFAKQPQASPQDIIAKTQATAPKQPPKAAPKPTPAQTRNVLQFPGTSAGEPKKAPEQPAADDTGQSDFDKTAQQLQNQPKFKPKIIPGPGGERKVTQPRPGVTRVRAAEPAAEPAANVTDIDALRQRRQQARAVGENESKQIKEQLQVSFPDSDPKLGILNLDLLDNAFEKNLPNQTLVFGEKSITVTAADIYSIIRDVEEQSENREIQDKYASRMLSSFDQVQRYLRSDRIAKYRTEYVQALGKAKRSMQKVPGQMNLNFRKGTTKPVTKPVGPQPSVDPQLKLFNGKQDMKNLDHIQESLMEKYMGFKAVEKAAEKGGAKDPGAVAASVGRKKYGKAKFQKAAAAGKKLGEEAKPDFLDLDKDGDTEEPMKKAAKDAKEHEPAKPDSDAVAKRKRLQALKDKQEDERAERGEDNKTASRIVKGRAYGGAAQKDTEEKDDLDEGAMKHAMHKDAEEMSLEQFCDKYGEVDWVKEFYNDINKPLDEQAQSSNENGQFVGYSDFMDAEISSITSFLDKQGVKHSLDQGKDAHGLKYTNLVVFNIDDKLKKRIDDYLNKRSEKYNAENTAHDGYLGYEPEDLEESGLQAYLGKKKYGKEGMQALQKAGREGASKEKMAMIRAKHDKMDEVAPPGAKAERMVKHIKKGYAKDGKLTKKEKGIAFATAWKAKKAGKLEESRNAESSEYTYETIGRILCDEQPHLDSNSEAFVNAVYDELIEMKLTPKAARWLVHYDEDFLSDCATSYGHFCRSKEKEMAECGAPMNTFVSEEPMVDAVQELDEIARLAGLAPKMEAKCSSCGCADCKCNEGMETCKECGMMEDKCSCTHESMVDESAINEAATRKDFRAVAELLKNIEDAAKRTELALHHAEIFKQQNPRFKKEMFLAAAGVDTSPIKDESIETEGNAFTGKLAATPKGGEFKLGDKTFKDTSDLEEETATEGNEFSGALAKAKAAGEKEFEVDGKKYTVKEDINLNVSATGEEDVVNLIRKLSGMPMVAIQAQPAMAEEIVAEEGPTERDIEYTNTPREEVAGTDAAIPSGTDLNRAKKQYRKEYPGDNPMAVKEAIQDMLWEKYETMINDVKA